MANLVLRLDPRQLLKGADQAEDALHGVRDGAQVAESAVDRLSRSQVRAGGRMRSYRGGIQNTAFQIQDIATQLSMGTAASVALGQQLPQLLGGLGVMGAVIGAVVAIGIPLVAMMGGLNDSIIDFNALFPVMSGALGVFEGVAAAAGSALTFLAENLERIIIIAATAATFFAGRWVAGMVAARLATMTLAGSLAFLRAALIRTGIGALIVGVGELIYQFARLASAVGGIGDAFVAVKNVFLEVVSRIAMSAQGLWRLFKAGALVIQRAFVDAFSGSLRAFNTMANSMGQWLAKLGKIPGIFMPDLSVGTGAIAGADALSADLTGRIDSLGRAASDSFEGAGAPLKSVQAIRDAVAGVNAELKKTPKALEDLDSGAKKVKETAEKIGSEFENMGGSAIDQLIDGTRRWQDVIKELIIDLLQLQLKQNLLAQMGASGDANASLGTNIFKAALTGFSGIKFFDQGGSLPVGQTGVVGEYGPELVTATPSGAQITGRRSTASGGGQSVDVRVAFDDDGGWKAYVEKVGYQAANAGSQMAVGQVKESLPGWMPRLNTDGAIA